MTINISLPSFGLSPKALGLLACLTVVACSAIASAAETCTKTTTVKDGPNGTTIIQTHSVCTKESR